MEVTPIGFDHFRSNIETVYSSGKHAHKTRLRVVQVLRELAALDPPVTRTDQLTTETMARYVRSKGVQANPNTVNGLLGSISSACTYAIEEGWLARPPLWKRVRLRPRPMTQNRPPAYDQMTRLLGDLAAKRDRRWEDHRLCAMVWTFALTGVRFNELLHSRLEDLELILSLTLKVSPRRRLKTEASARDVPIADLLAEMLRGWLPHSGPDWLFPGVRRKGPWNGGGPRYTPLAHLKRAAREVGIETITFHALRHAFGTYSLERWGLPVWVVQRVMGHTDPRTTQRYMHLDGSPAIAAAVRGIGYRPTA
jgi:integrase